jgi:general secretion pathway protein N
MKRAVLISAAGVAAFLVVLIFRFPAKWGAALLPENVSCSQLGGTVWNGTCLGLVVQGMPAGDVKWDLHALRLFTGKLGLDLAMVRGPASVQGDVSLGFSGAVSARDVKARLPLDATLLPWVPPGMQGTASADLASLKVEGKIVSAIEGIVEVRGLQQGPGSALGDYRLTFPPGQGGAEPVGQLTDLGSGPLTVAGTLKLTREPGYVIEGLVAAKPGAPEQMTRQLQYLGAPDAQGRRPFSLAGTY